MKKRIQNFRVRLGLAAFAAVVFCAALSSPGLAATRYTLEPGLSVGWTYDDNIGLVRENTQADWIATFTPSIRLEAADPGTGISLAYRPSYLKYMRYSERDTFQHYLDLDSWHYYTQHLRLGFTNSYIKSDDPFEEPVLGQFIVQERHSYQINRSQLTMDYRFGPGDTVSAGYGHTVARYDNPTSGNRTDHGPFGTMTYWFDNMNGIEIGYAFTRHTFKENRFGIRDEDVNAHNFRTGYIRPFSHRTQGSVRYGLSIRDSKDPEEDYWVHDGSVGLGHAFSETLRLDTHAGAFKRTRFFRDDETGGRYGAQLAKTFQHGSLSLNAERGWTEDYLAEDRRGFARYWSAGVNFRRDLTDELGFHSGVSYRRNDRGEGDFDDGIYLGNAGLRWNFHRYYALGLDYRFAKRISDNRTDEYVNNRVTLSLSWRRPFRWHR